MKAELLYPSKYLRAGDFNGKPITKTIKSVKVDELHTTGGHEKKPVIYFTDTEKMLVMNRTNCRKIVETLGNETDNWAGARLTMYATTCDAFGKRTECIRIKSASRAPDAKHDPVTGEVAATTDAPLSYDEPEPGSKG